MVCPYCTYWVEDSIELCPKCRRRLRSPSVLQQNVAVKNSLLAFLSRFGYLFIVAAGIAAIAYGVFYYLSPLTRLKLNGIHLKYQPSGNLPPFLAGTHLESKCWAYRQGALDTPLLSTQLEETGTLQLEADLRSQTGQSFTLSAIEWVKTIHVGDTFNNVTLPKNHRTVSPAKVVLDAQGTLIDKRNADSPGVGRALNFLFFTFPKGVQHPGGTWMNQTNWEQTLGEWGIGWESELVWNLAGFEACGTTHCARLTYSGKITPRVNRPPAWAKNSVTGIAFDGYASGSALYNVREKMLTSNSFTYEGKLSIHIKNLELIPEEQRANYDVLAEPGTILFQFMDKLEVRIPI